MGNVLVDILAGFESDLAEAWNALVKTEKGTANGTNGSDRTWMSSLLQLLQRHIEDPANGNFHNFIGTLVEKGYLSRLPIGEVVRIFQLFPRAVADVCRQLDAKPPLMDDLVNEMILSACRSYDLRLSKSEEKFDTLFDNADLVILNIDVGGRIEKINRRGAKILGLDAQDVIGRQLTQLIFPEDLPTLTRNFGHVLSGNPQIFAIRAVSRDGDVRHLDIALTPLIEGGRITSMRAIARNVTEQMELQNRLAESEEKFRSLIEMAGDAIFLIALEDGRILDANNQARKMTGLSRRDIREHHIVNLFDRDDEKAVIALLQETITAGSSHIDELLLLNANGPDALVEISSSVIEFAGNRVIQSFVKDTGSRRRIERIMADQTQRLVEMEREMVEQRERLGQLERPSRASGLILMLIQRLSDEQAKAHKRGETLFSEEINSLLEAGCALLRPLGVDYQTALVDLDSLLERYVRLLDFIHRDQVRVQYTSQEVPKVFVPAEVFETIIASLLKIAVEVSLGQKEADVEVMPSLRGRMVAVEIHDSGKPISAFEMQNLFDEHYEYFDRDAKTLRHARAFLEEQGGGLLIQGKPKAGNLTTLFIPAYRDAADKDAAGYQMVLFEDEEESEP